MDSKLKRLGRRIAFEGEVVDLYKDTMEYPDGSMHECDYVHHKRGYGACVIPVLPVCRIVLVRQFRPAVDEVILEIPAGGIEKEDKDTLVCAKRELTEETGYTSNDFSHLLRVQVAVAYCNEWLDIYLAKDCQKAQSGQILDQGEDINVEIYTLDELLDKVYNFEIKDSKTVAAITAYAVKYGKKN